ncbi:amidohydrolase family protein [Desulfonatronovibrio hydrogenovorans]|uniref:amidohydrolase family protein n=1 Tax=Desulfonatronovibrio hydrogenovorans TaxID=53245 RepID=UPI00048C1333|nr:amidohydrolase family protein [Desulfonatronovibrio hydrogenovorans]
MSIDFHTHVFHPKIADKVLDQLKDHYGIRPVGTGLVEDLFGFLDQAGIDRAVVHTAATSPDQVIPANNWALSLNRDYPRLTAFGTIHPGYTQWEKELDRLEQKGIKGIKLHPDFQGFDLNDPGLGPIFETIGQRFIMMFHVGDRLPPDQNPSSPGKLARIKSNFPLLNIVAAHLGGYLHWEDSIEHLAGTDIYLDTSSSLSFIDKGLLKIILDRHPRERLFFGSDYPLFDPGQEVQMLQKKAGLNDVQIDQILNNGRKFLGEFVSGLEN